MRATDGERTEDGRTGLKRTIAPRVLLLFVLGDILGTGIYALVGEVAGEVGGAIWVALLVALVLAFFTAASYSELVTKYPEAAGAALYVNKAFRNSGVTFMVTFAVMASGLTSAGTAARAFGGDDRNLLDPHRRGGGPGRNNGAIATQRLHPREHLGSEVAPRIKSTTTTSSHPRHCPRWAS